MIGNGCSVLKSKVCMWDLQIALEMIDSLITDYDIKRHCYIQVNGKKKVKQHEKVVPENKKDRVWIPVLLWKISSFL